MEKFFEIDLMRNESLLIDMNYIIVTCSIGMLLNVLNVIECACLLLSLLFLSCLNYHPPTVMLTDMGVVDNIENNFLE